jgi:hypothetical protein
MGIYINMGKRAYYMLLLQPFKDKRYFYWYYEQST